MPPSSTCRSHPLSARSLADASRIQWSDPRSVRSWGYPRLWQEGRKTKKHPGLRREKTCLGQELRPLPHPSGRGCTRWLKRELRQCPCEAEATDLEGCRTPPSYFPSQVHHCRRLVCLEGKRRSIPARHM